MILPNKTDPVKLNPDFSRETQLLLSGFQFIAGVDEVGRGPLAGPVVSAAVILDPNKIPDGLNDSKKLGAARREVLCEQIFASAEVGIASVPACRIDQINILQASLEAMRLAIEALPSGADFALMDGNKIPLHLNCKAQAIIRGDALSLSISAASIVAKVTRDRMMILADRDYPGYGFASNKGYGAAMHMVAIARMGPCDLHRLSFSPFKQSELPV